MLRCPLPRPTPPTESRTKVKFILSMLLSLMQASAPQEPLSSVTDWHIASYMSLRPVDLWCTHLWIKPTFYMWKHTLCYLSSCDTVLLFWGENNSNMLGIARIYCFHVFDYTHKMQYWTTRNEILELKYNYTSHTDNSQACNAILSLLSMYSLVSKIRVCLKYTKLALLVFLYCLNLRMN